MKQSSVEFGQNARRVYTAVKKAILDCGDFRGVRCDDRTFRIQASHGLPLFGEDVNIKVVATGVDSCEVVVKSADKLFFNIFKWGNNKRNVGNIMDFVRNEVYRLLPVVDELGRENNSRIRIVKPDIKLRNS